MSKEVVLGVTGSIAGYKACEIASRLVGRGYRVTPVLTQNAQELVGAATFQALTGQRVITRMFEPVESPEIEHIAVAQRADLFLIAPASANILAKAAHGIADDWLSTTLLATRAPILFAPAMNTNMYSHPATQANIKLLTGRGCHFVGPDSGRLACGDVGAGRMIAPEVILEQAEILLSERRHLEGKRVLITSGGNREPIDPVRYIGNRSSGKMGAALAMEALLRGAEVIVVTGPAEVELPHAARVFRVETALEMADAVARECAYADVVIGAAAVADYRVDQPSTAKHKRGGAPVTFKLVENPDILGRTAAAKRPGQIVVGFAAETEQVAESALEKLRKKNLDLIVANEVGAPDSTFGDDRVRAGIFRANDSPRALERLSKTEIARALFDEIVSLL